MDGFGAKRTRLPEVFTTIVITAFLWPVETTSAAERKQSAAITPVAAAPAAPKAQNAIPVATVSRQRKPLFFGYLEFDFDPDAPGGVPGFGPLGTGQ